MLFLGIVIAAMLLKYFSIGPFAMLGWWLTLIPFACAAAWWAYADASGYTKRREMDKMERRKQERIDKQRDAMGMLRKRQ